jgi:hypothetical protein
MRRLVHAAALAASIGLVGLPTTSQAQVTPVCSFPVGPIPGNLVVPSGQTVCLQNQVVGGDVTIQPGGILWLIGEPSTIRGSVNGTNIELLRIETGSRVNGSVTVNGGNFVEITATSIRGNLTLLGIGGSFNVVLSNVRGDVIANANPGSPLSLFSNTIRGKLSCSGNTPPLLGSGNVANGGKLGQCAGL